MSVATPDRHWAVTALFLAPALHPLLFPVVGVPSHLLWFVHVLPVASWTYHRGRTAGALAIVASLLLVMAGERAFGAGYFVAADWRTAVSLAVSLGLTCALVGGFALYARKAYALQQQLWHSQKLETLALFSASVAHDFNNLLTAITLSSELALEELPNGHAVREHVQEVKHSADRAALLTKRLLGFARRDVVQPDKVNVNAVVEGMEVLLRRVIATKVDVLIRLQETGVVHCDPGHVEQILTNLVVNASDAMPDGGVVTIETGTIPNGHAYLSSGVEASLAGYAMVAVSDTGVGIDDTTRSRIFEPLYTTKPPGKGTGLGLSTVRSLANEWGGCVTVTSTPHRGSTFRVFLPVVTEADRLVESTSSELLRTAVLR